MPFMRLAPLPLSALAPVVFLLPAVLLPSCGDDDQTQPRNHASTDASADARQSGGSEQQSPASPSRDALEHDGRAQYQKAREWAQKASQGTEGAFEKALEWTRKAADNGYREAQLTLAALYFYGHEKFPRDATKARDWFEKAARQGASEAHYYLGVLYAYGEGVEKDAKKAAEELSIAAKAGVAEAQYQLGMLYIDNERTLEDGLEWLKKAAEHAQVDAAMALGKIYARGKYSLGPDMHEAALWYHRAAQEGNVQAQYVYALMCLTGSGVTRDDKQGMSWLQLAAGQGYLPAVRKLAECYRTGEGTAPDAQLADTWQKRAEELETNSRQQQGKP